MLQSCTSSSLRRGQQLPQIPKLKQDQHWITQLWIWFKELQSTQSSKQTWSSKKTLRIKLAVEQFLTISKILAKTWNTFVKQKERAEWPKNSNGKGRSEPEDQAGSQICEYIQKSAWHWQATWYQLTHLSYLLYSGFEGTQNSSCSTTVSLHSWHSSLFKQKQRFLKQK